MIRRSIGWVGIHSALLLLFDRYNTLFLDLAVFSLLAHLEATPQPSRGESVSRPLSLLFR
jgi:hypothetical protein